MRWIRESNLIEGVDDPKEDERSEKAYNWLLLEEHLKLANICKVHDMVMEKKLPRYERGRWRTCRVIVGGRLCPPPAAVSKLMEAWEVMYSRAGMEEGIKRSHIEFEKIHPFIDGNGRVGRMLMNWQREKAGFPPLTIFNDEKGAYYEWFKRD